MFEFLFKNNDISSLLSHATELKKKDVNRAIETLKRAYVIIAKSNTEYSIDTFLRLPLYLQEAGRTDEAIAEFNILLKNGYPNQNKIPELIPMAESHIYDKLRLFWQREKQPIKAISYGIYSILLDALGLYRQKRYEELKSVKDKAYIIDRILPLFKKAKKLDIVDKTAGIMLDEFEKLPNISTHAEIEILVNNLLDT